MDKCQEIVEKHHSNSTGFCRHYMFLYSVILGMEAKNVFEFGSGYSSKTILFALEETGGHLTSCDCRSIQDSCSQYFGDEFESMARRWTYLNKRSSAIKENVEGKIYDVVLHDGSHTWREVANDLKIIVPKIKKGGILMVHDTNHPTEKFQLDKSIEFIPGNFEKVTLPYGYGLTLIRILEDFGNGEVEIKWRKQTYR